MKKVFYLSFTFLFSIQLYGYNGAFDDSIPLKVDVIHANKFNKIRSKGYYSIWLHLNDSSNTRLWDGDNDLPHNGFVYINDSILSNETFIIKVTSFNYLYRKYKVRAKNYTIISKKY